MAIDHRAPERPVSEFQRKLDADPVLAAHCEQVVRECRAAAEKELLAVERSGQLTAEDFAVVINARADDLFDS